MLKLYGSLTSPYVRHCRIALLQENHPFEVVPTDYAASAANSPTKRVPFMEEDGLVLTDSTSILQHVRGRAGKPFLATAAEADVYFLADTALDTAVNLFLLERDGLTDSPYLTRQRERLTSCFEALEQVATDWDGNWSDGPIRIGCLLAWTRFRNRFDHSGFEALARMMTQLGNDPHFQATAPPPA